MYIYIRDDMMWCDVIWCDVIWYDMTGSDHTIWIDMIWYDMICYVAPKKYRKNRPIFRYLSASFAWNTTHARRVPRCIFFPGPQTSLTIHCSVTLGGRLLKPENQDTTGSSAWKPRWVWHCLHWTPLQHSVAHLSSNSRAQRPWWPCWSWQHQVSGLPRAWAQTIQENAPIASSWNRHSKLRWKWWCLVQCGARTSFWPSSTPAPIALPFRKRWWPH